MQNSNETKSHSTDVSDGQELFKRDLQMPEKRIRWYYSIAKEAAGIYNLIIRGELLIFVRRGYNLPDKDGLWNKSDPYVEFIVYRRDGTHVRKTSSTKKGTLNPYWHDPLYFGDGPWKRFNIRAWDSDPGNDDPLSDQKSVDISFGNHQYLWHMCYSGHITYDYGFLA